MAPLAAVMLPAMLAAFIGIILFSIPVFLVAAVRTRVQGRQVMDRMRAANRLGDWEMVEREVPSGSGTLIWESLTLGWNQYRIWWVAEDVRAVAVEAGLTPAPEGRSLELVDPDHPDVLVVRVFERWCRDRYLDLDQGRARLVEVIHSDRKRKKARQRIDAIRQMKPSVGLIDINLALLEIGDPCPHCRYDRMGLDPGAPCPECGSPITRGET